jgi:hypothetical protein
MLGRPALAVGVFNVELDPVCFRATPKDASARFEVRLVAILNHHG